MAFDVYYTAWDTSANTGKTGDSANHTITVEVEGTDVTGLAITEEGNGRYKVSPSDVQLPEGSTFNVHGSSTTGDVVIIGQVGVRPPTSAAIRTEMDNNSSQLAAIVADTNELQSDDVPGLIAALNDLSAAEIRTAIGLASANLDTQLSAIDTVVDSVLTDTNELQTDNVPGLIAALNDLSAAEIRSAIGLATANLDTQLSAITADTNEVQGDLTDGGRLDLLIDAIKAKTDSLTFTGSDVKATLDGESVTVGTNNDKTDYSLSTSGIAAVWAYVVDGTYSAVQLIRMFSAVLLGKASRTSGTTTFRNLADTKDVYSSAGDGTDRTSATVEDAT